MNVIALLSWFDERPAFLARAIRTAHHAGCTALVALDGRYADYPSDRDRSPAEQYRTIEAAAKHIPYVICAPPISGAWETEMEKRTRLFQLGETFAGCSCDSWFLILDADYELQCSTPLPGLLPDVPTDVAEVRLLTPPGPNGSARFGPPPEMRMRCLFRALPGLRVEGDHYTYVTADGRRLWGNPSAGPLEPSTDLGDEVTIRHWTYHRPKARVRAQFVYYRARDDAGLERGQCGRCGALASAMVPTGLRDLGAEVEVGWLPVCEACEPAAVAEARLAAAGMGADPAQVTVRVPLVVA